MFANYRLKLQILALAAVVLVFTATALAGDPKFTTLDYPGASATLAFGINPAGDVVGAYDDASGEHGFLWHNGVFTSFDYPGSTWTDAYGISPQGGIIGQYGMSDNTTHGFLLLGGNFYPVEVPGPTDMGYANSMPYKISPSGLIVGCYHQSKATGAIIGGTMHGFALNAEGVAFDSTPGTMHQGVNPDGAVAGYDSADPRSYVIANGVQSWFVYPGAAVTRATDIAANGDVIGWYKDASAHFHGFLKRQDAFETFDVELPGVLQTRPYGLNALGDIVGYYLDATGWHGFLFSRRAPE